MSIIKDFAFFIFQMADGAHKLDYKHIRGKINSFLVKYIYGSKIYPHLGQMFLN